MLMLYNSDSFAVVQFDLGTDASRPEATRRGGYEIVDKFARKEIYLDGAVGLLFKAAIDALVESGPSEEDLDELIGRYSALAQQPLVLH
ncbi:MAG: DUF3567 domain-containing protein [Burkholderiaceae bacterium]